MPFTAKLARLLLLVALLAAQQAAIAHGLWHAAGGAPDQVPPAESGQLCDQHSAFGTVLGALGNALPASIAGPPRAAAVAALPRAGAPATPFAPSSRDPPSRL